MPLNIENIRRNEEKLGQYQRNRGQYGKLWKFPEGHTIIYVCDGLPGMEGLFYLTNLIHPRVTARGFGVTCIAENNQTLYSDRVQKHLQNRKIKLDGNCPICAALEDSTMAEGIPADTLRGMTVQPEYYMNLVPIGSLLSNNKVKMFGKQEQVPQPHRVCETVRSGLVQNINLMCGDMDDDDMVDPTNPEAAVFFVVTREDQQYTQYDVNLYAPTARKPVNLTTGKLAHIGDALKRLQVEGGECDLYRIIANFTQPANVLEEHLDALRESSGPRGRKGRSQPRQSARRGKVQEEAEEDDFPFDVASSPEGEASKEATAEEAVPPSDQEVDEDSETRRLEDILGL